MSGSPKPTSWLETVNCAIEGVLWAAKSQRHLRWHFISAIVVLGLALYLRISSLALVLLTFAITLVLFAELVNTAFEVLVDLVSPDYHPLARIAKDVAAGAVLVASIGAVAMGYFALARYLVPLFESGGPLTHRLPGELAVVSLLAVTMLVVLLKARFGSGTPLHGGMPSGHAAVAFSIATSVALSRVGLMPILLAFMLAVMVSHSRLLMRIHTLREVLLGALLGVVVTLVIYLLFA